MITRIEAYGYRCFPRLSVDLSRYHVLAGSNGAGKTTLLDIPNLLGDLLGQHRAAAAAFLERQGRNGPPRAGTLIELLHKRQGEQIAFAIEAQVPPDIVETLADRSLSSLLPHALTHLRYELSLNVEPEALTVADEYLFLFAEEGIRPEPGVFPQGRIGDGHDEWQEVILRAGTSPTKFVPETTSQATDIPALRVPTGQLALGAVPADPTLFPAALWFAQLLREGVVFFDPDWELLRRPAPPEYTRRLLPSGRNAPWLAYDLARRDPDRYASSGCVTGRAHWTSARCSRRVCCRDIAADTSRCRVPGGCSDDQAAPGDQREVEGGEEARAGFDDGGDGIDIAGYTFRA
ncbi:hypothetical protein NE236_31015 [Actinoallomurus purpureus]|uniref:AAA family ATPase n=1 Tax=Actinoallomurus purpureus TaxID=478114 RepID=UPI002092BD07|nr:hypothetical protein [Actinoallomurus purpureus]MCO6009411.1 hypothetical protein [Actinoallomurus purpureus]